jgi:uncharacterized membrane protein
MCTKEAYTFLNRKNLTFILTILTVSIVGLMIAVSYLLQGEVLEACGVIYITLLVNGSLARLFVRDEPYPHPGRW